eukprot:TRINITY_DN238_c2_g1_i1.p2 TRINITY_DN238_c2_g1~~TRINITY_DN238_c2_g1_i1.p2  ORF type:complete len:272 (-),score=112.66 TRINITY_DN238_c2_g1_i1:144-926(-)
MAFLARMYRPSAVRALSSTHVTRRLFHASAATSVDDVATFLKLVDLDTEEEANHMMSKFQPKIRLPGGSGQLAKLAFVAAGLRDVRSKVESDLTAFGQGAKENKEFHDFLSDPDVNPTERAAGIADLLKSIKADELTGTFLDLLIENGKIKNIAIIADNYVQFMKADRNEVKVTITSAAPLTPPEADELKSILKDNVLSENQQLELELKVQSDLIGGLTIGVGDIYADLSVKGELDNIRDKASEAIETYFDKRRAELGIQ